MGEVKMTGWTPRKLIELARIGDEAGRNLAVAL
jgi:hypothetical protein